MPWRHPRILDAAVLILFCGVIAITRWHTYTEPADWDISTYAVIGHELNNGQSLYSDIWDVKPPLVYISYALSEKLTGYGLGEVYLLAILTACGTMIGIWYAASTAGRAAGLVAAAAYTIVGGDLHLQANRANTEAFINLCLVWGIGLLLRLNGVRSRWRLLVIGLFFAAATLFKQVAIAMIAAVVVAHVLQRFASDNRKAAIRQALIIAATVAAAWGITFAYFALTGRGNLFWITSFIYPRFYGGNALVNLYTSLHLRYLIPTILFPLLPCAMLTLVALAWPVKTGGGESRGMLLAMMIGAQVSIGMLQQFYDHYYQFWLLPLCIGAGWGAAGLSRRVHTKAMPCAAIALVIFALVWNQVPSYRLSAAQWSDEKNGMFHTRRQSVGRELGQMLAPDETFFDWSENNTWLYFVSQRRPLGPGLWRGHMHEGPMAQWLTEQTLRRLRANPPKIVIEWFSHHMDEDHPITQWIVTQYQPLEDGIDRYPLIVMKRKE